ncbi:MAG: asparaginase [Pseudomonadota bacterium]
MHLNASNPPVAFAEVWRGEFLECVHFGHAVVCDAAGDVVHAWGDPDLVFLPRSSSKMIQALPLVTSGAADRFGLSDRHLALACASHAGAAIHTDLASDWLSTLSLDDTALRCGSQSPRPEDVRDALILAGQQPCQVHNNCSGKHTGFLTVGAHLGAGPEYIQPDHPVQLAVRDAFEDATGMTAPGYAIDGCSAPNFATTLTGAARAMAKFATAHHRTDTSSQAASRLAAAMMRFPELVSGEGQGCTEIMRAAEGRAAVKTGAEGVYFAILPDLELGIALKIVDGAGRGAECAIAALLVRFGVLDRNDPRVKSFLEAPILNLRDLVTGHVLPSAELVSG